MRLLKLDLNRFGAVPVESDAADPHLPGSTLAAVGRGPVDADPQTQNLLELWPPATIARRLEVRERELQRILDDMRRSIDHLRRDREVLIGQLWDLGRPMDDPADADSPPHAAQTAVERGATQPKAPGRNKRWGRRRAQREAQPPMPPVAPAVQDAAVPAACAVVALETPEVRVQPAALEPTAVPEVPEPLLRTPEEEFEALVQRLRASSPDSETEALAAGPRGAEAQRAIGPARLAAVAATAALIVLGTPTVGQVESDAGPLTLPSRARFLDVMEPPDLGAGVVEQGTGETPVPVPSLRLELTTLRPAWIQAVIDDDWQIEQVVAGGVTIPVDGRSAISLILSDAGAVRLRVNGEDQGTAGGDGEAIARQFENSTVVTTTPPSEGTTPE